jgi:hypothetical protein
VDLGSVGRELADGHDVEAQIEVVVLVPRDPMHVDVEEAGSAEPGREPRLLASLA